VPVLSAIPLFTLSLVWSLPGVASVRPPSLTTLNKQGNGLRPPPTPTTTLTTICTPTTYHYTHTHHAKASLILTHECHLGSSAHSSHFPRAALVLFEQQAMLQHCTDGCPNETTIIRSLARYDSENNAERVDKIQIFRLRKMAFVELGGIY
jgi:hypothetical protein